MKRFTLFVFLVAMVTSPMMAERVTPETARKVATTFLTNNGAKATQLTDLTKTAGFQNLYIFNGNPGFVVMSADDRVQPILGYSLTNAFVAEGMPENIRGWLQGYNDEIQYAVDNRISTDAETTQLWKDLIEGNSKAAKATPVVDNLLSTTWDQDPRYNNLCPYSSYYSQLTVTGCVATAMAQIMKYWNYPPRGIGSHSYIHEEYTDANGYHQGFGELSADFGATTYDWANMPNALSPSSSADQIEAVATLMYHCGVSVDMDYGVASIGGSGTATSFVATALQTYFNYQSCTFKYKADNEANWVNMLKTELNADRPLQYSGRGTGGGHSFVCCGYDSDDKFYFNWGWSGNNDGFYALNNLVPGSGGSGGGSYSFTDNQGAIFGIHPSTCTADAPTGLTYTQNGRDVTFNWNAASGAASYKIYCDNDPIGNATTNSYATTAPYGTHFYYVRSVDAGGELSLSTNSVTITVNYQTPIVNDLQMTLSGSDADLSWTAPDWCYPETPSVTLTYGDGSINAINSSQYWAHRYLAANLSSYINKAIYKISFYAYESGTYTCYIYKGATEESYGGDDIFWPTTLVTSKTFEVTIANKYNWFDIDLDAIAIIDGTDDLWVVLYDHDDGGGRYPAAYSTTPGSNNHGGYWGKWNDGGGNKGYVLDAGKAFLIRTYLTDGTYTYHLYDNGVSVADDIATTNYTVTSLASNTAHQYTVKTNYYGGETAASNLAGITLGTASIANLALGTNDKMTVTEGSKLTVTGTLSNSGTATNLVVESGGQLVTSNAVAATVKKDITGYNGGTGKWYLIASPVNSNLAAGSVDNLIDGTYDLYRLDQSKTSNEWCNYKANTFTIDNQKGYLYANNADVTLEFSGSMKPSNANVAVDLAYTSGNRIAGYNLVGNPFPCNAYANKAYYAMNAAGTNFEAKTTNDAIAPCTGVVVCATGTGQSVTFSKTAPDASISKGCLQIALAQANEKDGVSTLSTGSGSGSTTDNAIVSFNEGEELGKFVFNDEKAKIYLTQNGKDYAIATSDGTGEMPLNFKATENGIYSLTVNPKGTELSYLHLIDKLTGNDIDLLTTPSYTFEAKSNDSAKRFRLVFGGSSTGSETAESFAYFDGSEWVIENNGEATLQVVDVMGRVLRSETVNGDATADINNLSAGVYVLRLVNGEQVKTQKIVIE